MGTKLFSLVNTFLIMFFDMEFKFSSVTAQVIHTFKKNLIHTLDFG